MPSDPVRIVLGIPSGTQSLYARTALDMLATQPEEVHVILPTNPNAAFADAHYLSEEIVSDRATETYAQGNIGAPMASGSWSSAGLLLLPSPDHILQDISTGYSSDLFTRTADVMLKERRELVVVPFSEEWDETSIRWLTEITEAGGTVFPPFPSFYTGITQIDPMVERIVARGLSRFGIEVDLEEWQGV